jgi:hypothetical protein
MRIAICTFAACALMSAVPALAQMSESKASELRAEIAEGGTLRVIVTVSTVEASGDSPAAARSRQEQVLRALEGMEHQVVFVFPSTPLLALVVGRDALEVLLSHPLVTSITVDRPRAPAAARP